MQNRYYGDKTGDRANGPALCVLMADVEFGALVSNTLRGVCLMRTIGTVTNVELLRKVLAEDGGRPWQIGVEERAGRFVVLARPRGMQEPCIIMRQLKTQAAAERAALAASRMAQGDLAPFGNAAKRSPNKRTAKEGA